MVWNDLKFQLLRIEKNKYVKNETPLFSPNMGSVIERKDCIRDWE